MSTLLIACFASALAAWLLLRFERLHARISYDHAAAGPQKFHDTPTPRIGGVPIAAGSVVAFAIWSSGTPADQEFALALGASILPAFASGLIEDFTKRIGPDIRLWASFLSALVAALLFDTVVTRSGLPAIDALLSWYPLALGVTVFGIGGVAHAMNLIDGYNGLAGVVAMLMYAALGFVAWCVDDAQLVTACLALLGATAGFLVWNFPRGRLFAGDGGAYLWGVSIAIIAVLLIQRHEAVSPWFALTVVLYPVFETAFSIYRRKFKQAAAAGLPDARHLHQMIYRRVLSPPPWHAATAAQRLARNSATSPFLWALASLVIVPAVFVWDDHAALMGLVAMFCVTYVWIYQGITRFHTPNFLRRLGRLATASSELADSR